MPTKYYQNISKGITIIERTSFCLQTNRRKAYLYIPRTLSRFFAGKTGPHIFFFLQKYNHFFPEVTITSLSIFVYWDLSTQSSQMSAKFWRNTMTPPPPPPPKKKLKKWLIDISKLLCCCGYSWTKTFQIGKKKLTFFFTVSLAANYLRHFMDSFIAIQASTGENLSSGFPTEQDSNQSSQLQKLARKLIFCS